MAPTSTTASNQATLFAREGALVMVLRRFIVESSVSDVLITARTGARTLKANGFALKQANSSNLVKIIKIHLLSPESW
jgi:hypothetical protein